MYKATTLAFGILHSILSYGAFKDEVSLGTPIYNGSGCPLGAAHAHISEDAQKLSLSFSQFKVDAGGEFKRNLDRKNCSILVPINIPEGYIVAVNQISYRGSIDLPLGSYGKLKATYSFADKDGGALENRWEGTINDSFLLSQQIPSADLIWSTCREDAQVASHVGMMLRSNENNDSSFISLDGDGEKAASSLACNGDDAAKRKMLSLYA